MTDYIKNNWVPLVVGFAVSMVFNTVIKLVESVIIKIALITVS